MDSGIDTLHIAHGELLDHWPGTILNSPSLCGILTQLLHGPLQLNAWPSMLAQYWLQQQSRSGWAQEEPAMIHHQLLWQSSPPWILIADLGFAYAEKADMTIICWNTCRLWTWHLKYQEAPGMRPEHRIQEGCSIVNGAELQILLRLLLPLLPATQKVS